MSSVPCKRQKQAYFSRNGASGGGVVLVQAMLRKREIRGVNDRARKLRRAAERSRVHKDGSKRPTLAVLRPSDIGVCVAGYAPLSLPGALLPDLDHSDPRLRRRPSNSGNDGP
jgi:hypothetical protein